MKKFSLVLSLVLMGIVSLLAQRTVTGTVVDETNEPLIGASILVKGTTIGTVTEADGTYTLTLSENATTLIFSYTGYATQEIPIGASNVIDVTLTTDVAQLSEVVVTGYSEVERRRLTASVSTIDNEAIENVPLPDVNQLIQGRAPGVLTTAPSGQPGAQQAIRIRGTGSITAGRGPLYVIDGVIIEQGDLTTTTTTNDVLANINPNDIENISILKDAAATALYGARGSNGVILITTKRGRAGATVITAKAQYGTTQPNTGNFDLMNGEQIWNYERQVLANSGYTPEEIDELYPQSLLNTSFDWVDAAFRQGQTSNLELQASGGNEKTRFFVSGGYFQQDGILIESDFNRLSLRSNIDHMASDKLDFSLNFNASYTDNLNAGAGNNFSSPLLGAFVNTPLQSPINPATGEYYTGLEPDWTIFTGDNFLYSAPLNPSVNRNLRLISKVSARYRILPNLNFTQTANIDFINIRENNFFDPTTADGAPLNGAITDAYNENRTLTTQSLLRYFTTLSSDHNLDALAGFEFQRVNRSNFNATGIGLASGQLKYLGSAAEPQTVGGFSTDYSFVSVLGQVNYNFREKYFLTVSARNDGSSRFGANNRYATFYSVGGSWILTSEDFLQNGFFNNLRLRASYGTSGNADIENFRSQELYSFATDPYNLGSVGYNNQPGSVPAQIANPDLTWEISKNLNVGLDFAVLNSRLSGTIEWYNRRGEDLLLNVPVSSTSGFTTALRNVGAIRNSGVELTLSTAPFIPSSPNGFRWNIDFNFSANRNQILELPNDEDIINPDIPRQLWREGEPIRTQYMQVWAGVDPANGKPLW
ncbi:MAG: SusC/RagA family TonB-linked outer membrane protein, partial [Saprospiraceae bacterium]